MYKIKKILKKILYFLDLKEIGFLGKYCLVVLCIYLFVGLVGRFLC